MIRVLLLLILLTGCSQKQVATHMGTGVGAVTGYTTCRALLNTNDPVSLAFQVISKKLSVRQTENLVIKAKINQSDVKNSKKGQPQNDIDTYNLEKSLSAQLKLAVRIIYNKKNKSGTVSIQYQTLNDLDNICSMILSQVVDIKQLND